MTEFEWVRELNESEKKIYSDMAEAGLPTPEYIETPNTVKLILRNNIDVRTTHRNEVSNEALNDDEQIIVEIIKVLPKTSQREIAQKTGFSRAKVQRIMKKMIKNKVIYREGAKKNGIWKVFGD